MSKLDSIDLMKLYSLGSNNGWNQFLTDCYRELNVNKLIATKVRLQRGMTDLAKKKLNSEEMVTFFLRLCRSIDLTIKKIDQKINPVLNDNPLNKIKDEKQIAKKKERDNAREAFIKKGSY